MQSPDKKNQPGKTTGKQRKGKTTKELSQEHLKDENHEITEEDFKNVLLSTDNPEVRHERLEIKDEKDRPKDEDKDPDIVTPWDVIK